MKKVSLLYLTSSLLIGNLFASEAEVIDGGAIISNRIRASLQNKDAKQLTNEEINRSNPSEYLVRLAIEMILESLRLQEMAKTNQTFDATTALNAGQEMFALGIASFDPSVNKGVHDEEHSVPDYKNKEGHLANHEHKEGSFVGHNEIKNEQTFVEDHKKDADFQKSENKEEDLINQTGQIINIEEIKEKETESHKSGPVINELYEESKQNYEKIKNASFKELEGMENKIHKNAASKFLIELFEDYKKEPNNFKNTDKILLLLQKCDLGLLEYDKIPFTFFNHNWLKIIQNFLELANHDFDYYIICLRALVSENLQDMKNKKVDVKELSEKISAFLKIRNKDIRKFQNFDDKKYQIYFETCFTEFLYSETKDIFSKFTGLLGINKQYTISNDLFNKIKSLALNKANEDTLKKICGLKEYFKENQRLDLGYSLIENIENIENIDCNGEYFELTVKLLNDNITQEQRDELLEKFKNNQGATKNIKDLNLKD